MILVCYDGSVDAQAAIGHTAGLMAGAEATVLTIWEPFIDGMIRSGAMGMGMAMGATAPFADDEKIDAANRQTALQTATDGARQPLVCTPDPTLPAATAGSPTRSSRWQGT